MTLSHGFPPVAAPGARVLILGSMPGQASLRAAEYYAHERNAFWRIMGDLLGAGLDLPYAQRLEKLTAAGVALWDVIAACERAGSLDADIVGHSVVPNDFAAFFAAHRSIARVFFNGAAAETAVEVMEAEAITAAAVSSEADFSLTRSAASPSTPMALFRTSRSISWRDWRENACRPWPNCPPI